MFVLSRLFKKNENYFLLLLKKKCILYEFLINYDFCWIELLFRFKLEVELKVIKKIWKLKNCKKFKIFKSDEDSESKSICI